MSEKRKKFTVSIDTNEKAEVMRALLQSVKAEQEQIKNADKKDSSTKKS